MDCNKYHPNRVRAQFSANTTAWQLIGITGAGYNDYPTLVAAPDTQFPGSVADFPTGIPQMIVRSKTAANADGSPILVRTNNLTPPGIEDDMISGSGQTLIFEDDNIKNVWIKKTVGTDIAILTGLY